MTLLVSSDMFYIVLYHFDFILTLTLSTNYMCNQLHDLLMQTQILSLDVGRTYSKVMTSYFLSKVSDEVLSIPRLFVVKTNAN